MNRYPLWKYLLVVAVIVVGAMYALPNFYGSDPSLQVSPLRAAEVSELTQMEVSYALEQAGVEPRAVELTESSVLVRFEDTDQQLHAQSVIAETMGRDFVVALHLAPATPAWLRALNAQPMFLGLDLRGGVHFLMEVDMDAAVARAEERYVSDIRSLLRDERIRYRTVSRDPDGGVLVRLRDAADMDRANQFIRRNFSELNLSQSSQNDDYRIVARLTDQVINETRDFALQQNITTLRKRVNELGVAEPVIQQQGRERVVVQLPGVQDTARAKEILGATATLEFRMVDTRHDAREVAEGRVPAGARLYRDRDGNPVLLRNEIMLTGDYIVNAASGIDQQTGGPAVFINLDGQGASIFSRRTREEIGNPMATVFIENKTETVRDEKTGELVRESVTIEEVINVATIRDQLGRRFQITGLESTQEARNLALLLRAGALAAPIEIIEERTVGPSLGRENIEQGFRSVVLGFILVLIFMSMYYRVFGMIASVALTANLVLILALLSLLQATLTMPGIAGIVLTVGMAVDANVLIYERIREELRNGNSPQASIQAGYDKAFSTIADANITTLIAALVLFAFGTGPIKGFAVTLSLGIVCSMFTAIIGTRALVNLIYGGRRVKTLAI